LQLERDKLEFERKKREEKFLVRNFGSITAGAISVIAVLISSVQVYIAWQQRRIAEAQISIASHQDQLAEAQTVQRFIPHLVGQESEKELALITMDSFVNRSVVTKLATKLPSKGSEAALQTLSKEGGETEKKLAQSALNELGNRRKQLVEQMFDEDKSTRIAATTQLIREGSADPKLIPLALDRANVEQNKGNQRNNSGIINTIVLLQNIKPELLKQYETEIVAFLERAKDNGPQTADLVSNVYALLSCRNRTHRFNDISDV
jgi:hypothetical protein